MSLLSFLFKTDEHKRLAELLWTDGLTASVHELANMSGLPYATAHALLQKMLKLGLVQKTKQGLATLFSSNLSADDLKPLKALLGNSKSSKRKPLADFPEMDLPLVGDLPKLQTEKAKSKEELLVKVVALAKENSTLLRTLPLLVQRLGTDLNSTELVYWSKLYHVDRELGFVLELTTMLSHEKKYSSFAKKLKDKRWAKPTFFLNSEALKKGYQAQLTAENTPELAKKWFLKMNMGIDSFSSLYFKFSER